MAARGGDREGTEGSQHVRRALYDVLAQTGHLSDSRSWLGLHGGTPLGRRGDTAWLSCWVGPGSAIGQAGRAGLGGRKTGRDLLPASALARFSSITE
jgi:hypothetical protein